jgi:hypothetical protein
MPPCQVQPLSLQPGLKSGAPPAQVGALVAGVVFGLVPDRTKFYISALCGLLGALVTLLLVPDISGLDLSEGTPTVSHPRQSPKVQVESGPRLLGLPLLADTSASIWHKGLCPIQKVSCHVTVPS